MKSTEQHTKHKNIEQTQNFSLCTLWLYGTDEKPHRYYELSCKDCGDKKVLWCKELTSPTTKKQNPKLPNYFLI